MADADDQVNTFFVNRAKLSEGIAETHIHDKDWENALKNLNQAYGFYLKAGLKNDAERMKKRHAEVKKLKESLPKKP